MHAHEHTHTHADTRAHTRTSLPSLAICNNAFTITALNTLGASGLRHSGNSEDITFISFNLEKNIRKNLRKQCWQEENANMELYGANCALPL